MSDYGPQHEQIVALIERTRTLTREEAVALGVARDAAWTDAWTDAWAAAWDAAWDAAWTDAQEAAWDAAREAADWDADRRAVGDTACALVVRDLIGQYGFTQDHYDLLTGAWRTVIGPIHPDDKDLS